ncbi:MAG: type II secretion system protein GspD [Lentisphaerae bacterium]|nr:type II secretion system protein GspD [Lentisphaerota bacterium]
MKKARLFRPLPTCRGPASAALALLLLSAAGPSAQEAPSLFPAAGGAPEPEGYINFSFDQVDVRAFVKLVGDITGREFIVSDGVEGRVTVVAPRIRRQDAYPIFVSILESIGCSVIEGEKVSRVVALGPRPTPPAPVYGAGEAVPERGVITRIIRLEHVSAQELRKAVESKAGAGAVSAVEETNHLIVTDTAEGVRRIEKIVAEIDKPGLAKVTEVVPLRFASAEDLARQLSMAMAETESRAEALRQRLPAVGAAGPGAPGLTIVAAPHSNSLILVGPQARITEIKAIIAKMDVDSQAGMGRLNAIFLKYISAEEAARSINGLLEKSAGKAPQTEAARRIAIEASVANNALLVDAAPSDLEVVRKLVDQLDQPREQVLIEVLIAEVSLDDSLDLGVEMAALGMPGPAGTVISGGSRLDEGTESLLTRIQNGIMPRGLTIGVARGDASAPGTVAAGAAAAAAAGGGGTVAVGGFPAAINIDALRRHGTFKILSQTSLEAENNLEATVGIVNEIPILKSTIQGGSGTARDIVQNIERMDVGIKLKITPHVIEGGEVRMTLNPTIEAVIDQGPAGTQFAPTIAKRQVSTTVTVPDGATIVIAGLTREDRTRVRRRVPLLGSVPLVGLLFRRDAETLEKTNMLIFVTPRVVTRAADAARAARDLQDRTGLTPEGPAPVSGAELRRRLGRQP